MYYPGRRGRVVRTKGWPLAMMKSGTYVYYELHVARNQIADRILLPHAQMRRATDLEFNEKALIRN